MPEMSASLSVNVIGRCVPLAAFSNVLWQYSALVVVPPRPHVAVWVGAVSTSEKQAHRIRGLAV